MRLLARSTLSSFTCVAALATVVSCAAKDPEDTENPQPTVSVSGAASSAPAGSSGPSTPSASALASSAAPGASSAPGGSSAASSSPMASSAPSAPATSAPASTTSPVASSAPSASGGGGGEGGSGGSGGSSGGGGEGGSAGGDGVVPFTFTEVAAMIEANCVTCHVGPVGDSHDPDLQNDSGQLYATLTSYMVERCEQPLVTPSDADSSAIAMVIEGNKCGDIPQMPLGCPEFCDVRDQHLPRLRAWIAAGAPEE